MKCIFNRIDCIGQAARSSVSSSRELENAAAQPLACGLGSADEQHGVIACQGADHIRRVFGIQRGGGGFRAANRRLHYEEHANAVESQEELRKQRAECGVPAFGRFGGRRVSRPFGRLHSGEPQLFHVTREGGLGDVPAPVLENLPQLLLAADHPAANQLENRVLPFALVSHGRWGRFVNLTDCTRLNLRH